MNDNIFKISYQKNHGNMNRIIFLANLQAEIDEVGFVTSLNDVMTSKHHTNKKSITLLNSVTQKTMETKNKKKNKLSSILQA